MFVLFSCGACRAGLLQCREIELQKGRRSVEHEASAAAAGSIREDGDLELAGRVQARARRRPRTQRAGQGAGKLAGCSICRRFDGGI